MCSNTTDGNLMFKCEENTMHETKWTHVKKIQHMKRNEHVKKIQHMKTKCKHVKKHKVWKLYVHMCSAVRYENQILTCGEIQLIKTYQ